MNNQSIQCPGCGQHTTIKYCGHCGTAIRFTCPSCGAKIEPEMHVCAACGTSHAPREAPRQWRAQTIVPWAAFTFACVALVIAIVALIERENVKVPVQFKVPNTTTSPAPGQAFDLSGIFSKEAANQLFNRVMTASENGDIEQVSRYAPVALLAYEGLGTLDNDARYHVALIHMAAGDLDSARASLNILRQSVPNHLLGFKLEYRIAEQRGDKAASDRADKAFLAAYDAQIAAGRVEYQDHWGGIERFRKAAQARKAE